LYYGGRVEMPGTRWRDDNERNIQLYGELVRKYGSDVRSLGWSSRESQARRFAVFAEIGNLKGASVLDVGCGLGDLYGWMRKKRLDVRYTGIDVTPGMVKLARQQFPAVQFRVQELLDVSLRIAKHDYVLSSGIFTHRNRASFKFLTAAIERMFELSKLAVGFNCLSAWAETKEPGEFHADPLKVLSFCRKLTPRVVLRHDYHPRDFTVYLYR
jgi:SAM-dependent methyltransferase